MKAVLFGGAAWLATFASPGATAMITATSDPVLYWNDIAAKTVGGSAPAQARAIAMMNAAVHDAVLRSYNGSKGYYDIGVAAPGGNARAAAAVAAHDVLKALYPANAGAYDTALATSLAQISSGAGKANGVATGTAYASAILARRTTDGSGTVVSYTPGTLPGEWRPTPPGFAPAAVPQWGNVTPFLLASSSQFRPGPPPALDSAAYTAAYNEVKAIGALGAATRTLDQTNSALFWDISNGTTWNRIGLDMLADDGLSTLENARVMAKLSTGIADSLIAGFDAKYTYNLWRPVTAIREGDADTNPDTVGDAAWNPLFATPAHPSYVSTHSMQSGAAAAILLALLPDRSFCNTIGTDTRCFAGIGQAAEDAANSRLWGGIHFRFDNEAGLATGRQVGEWTLSQQAFAAVPEPASWMSMIAGFALIGGTFRQVRRRASNVALL